MIKRRRIKPGHWRVLTRQFTCWYDVQRVAPGQWVVLNAWGRPIVQPSTWRAAVALATRYLTLPTPKRRTDYWSEHD